MINLNKRSLCFLMLGIVLTICFSFAQSSRRQAGPRALALVEVAPNGRARLIPIALYDNGKFYDAGLYHATPVPMALESETVYEGFRAGESVGLFTVSGAQEVNDDWYGLGRWRSNVEMNAKAAEEKDKRAKSAPQVDEDERPVLRRPGSASGASSDGAKAPAKQETPAQPTVAEARKAAASKPISDDDENRPVLRRGKPGETQVTEEPWDFPTAPTKPQPGVASTKPSMTPSLKKPTLGPIATFVAISDANSYEPRPYYFRLKPEEEQDYSKRMAALGSDEIRKFATIRPGRKPAETFADFSVRAFDVTTSNEPVLIFSARVPAQTTGQATQSLPLPNTEFQYYVTIVARIDVNGDLRKLFSLVTDTDHLDSTPRLELIDVVDADGNRSGELLFRQVFDRSQSYVLYRVGMDQLWELFEGAEKHS